MATPSFRRLRLLGRAAPLLRAVPEAIGRSLGLVLGRVWGSGPDAKLADLASTDGTVASAYPVLRQLFSSGQIEALTGNAGQSRTLCSLIGFGTSSGLTPPPLSWPGPPIPR